MTLKPLAEMTLEELHAAAVHRFVAGGGSRPAVLVVRGSDGEAVLKDFNRCGRAFRILVGGLFARREVTALQRLDGIAGIPRLIRPVGRRALLMQHLAGTQKATQHPAARDPAFLERLRALIAELHARGLAHCDLRRASNILVDDGGRPYLVDYVARVMRQGPLHPETWLFPALRRADDGALLKLKRRLLPELLTAEERAALAQMPLLDRLARGFGARVRDVFRWLFVSRGQGRKPARKP